MYIDPVQPSSDLWLAATAIGTLLLAFATAWLALEARSERGLLRVQFERSRDDARALHEEERALREVGMVAAVARELTTGAVYITAMIEPGPSRGLTELLPDRIWPQVELPLGELWLPDAVARIAILYHRVELANDLLRNLKETGIASTFDDAAVKYFASLRDALNRFNLVALDP